MRSNRDQLPDLRGEVIAGYLSTSPGIHRLCEAAAREGFIHAYEWHLRGWLSPARGARWLDLGCGKGQVMLSALRSGVCDVVGVDLSAEMLSACEALGLEVRRDDATESVRHLPSCAYGVASAFDVLEHLDRDEALALLRHTRRVLRPGGVMFIKFPNGASPAVGDRFCSDITHESLFTPCSLAQLANLASFSRCDVREVRPVPRGLRSVVRYALWKGVRSWCRLLNAIETESPWRDVTTRVMLVRLTA
jgi:SAM-dependent methyltransferase